MNVDAGVAVKPGAEPDPRRDEMTQARRTSPRFPVRAATPPLLAAAIFLGLGALPDAVHAQVRGAWEPFSSKTNADAWSVFDFADSNIYFPAWSGDPEVGAENPEIAWPFTADWGFWFYAEDTVSDGALVGDFAATGIEGIEVDVLIDDLAVFSELDIALLSDAQGYLFSESFIDVDFPEPGYYTITVRFDEDWFTFDEQLDDWVPVDITESFLSDIIEVGVRFFPVIGNTRDDVIGAIDNFRLLPTLQLPELSLMRSPGEFTMAFTPGEGQIHRIERLVGEAWEPVDGESDIVGPEEHVFTTPTDEGSALFRVRTEPDFVDITVPDDGGID